MSSFASKTNLAALKTEVDKIDTDKLKTAPTDLAKLTNAIENDVVKKTKVTSLTSQLNNLKSQHIAIEVTGIVSKTKKKC